jgi:DNA-binding response OmpR family regulator
MIPNPDSTARAASTAKVSHRILIVEDEEVLAFGVRDALRHAGHEPQVCHNGKTALEMLQRDSFDLVVLDLMLPGMSGLDLLRALRQHNHKLRVVILTAMSSEADVVRGFEAGADDYVPKPFSPRELLARVEAQFRRVEKEDSQPTQIQLPGGNLVDLARLEVSGGGKVVPLTPREGDILDYLVRNRHRVVTREDLLQDVWHYRNPNIETRTVDIHIVGLRRKIEPDPANPTLIQTVRGKGYRWFS